MGFSFFSFPCSWTECYFLRALIHVNILIQLAQTKVIVKQNLRHPNCQQKAWHVLVKLSSGKKGGLLREEPMALLSIRRGTSYPMSINHLKVNDSDLRRAVSVKYTF